MNKLRINLALQGGGAHGAFTWGVLDRLLESKDLEIESISGTSAGALNGLALVAGLANGGPEEGARRLHALWTAIASMGAWASWLQLPLRKPGAGLWDDMMPVVSPIQSNPLGMQPLGALLTSVVGDIARVRSALQRLHVNAVNVQTGMPRVFGPAEMSIQAVLASACAPMLFIAVEIEGSSYWDGSYHANPTLEPLYQDEPHGCDILLVELTPHTRQEPPGTALNILNRINEIASINGLRAELEVIRALNRRRKAPTIRCHTIRLDDSDPWGAEPSAKRTVSWDLFVSLRDSGRVAAQRWLDAHLADVGVRSTALLATPI